MKNSTDHSIHTKVLVLLLATSFSVLYVSTRLTAQVGPSPDPTPLIIILTRLEHNDTAGAERLMRDNLPVMKQRLEATIADFDQKFDDLGRSGATSGHDVHIEVLNNFIKDVTRYEKLFDMYSRLTGDQVISKRLEARRLRFEGAYYTHYGEDACGDTLDWAEAMRRYQTAMDRLEAGFALAKETNDVRLMASAKNNEGSTLIRMMEPDKAIEAYGESMKYADQLSGDMYRGLVDLNLGNTYVWMGDPETSVNYSQTALDTFKKMGRETWQANAMMNLGNAYLREQKFGTAWEALTLALQLAKQSGEDRVRGRALLNLGMAGVQLKKPEAEGMIKEALEWYAGDGKDIYTPIEREAIEQDGYRLLSRLARATGNERAAGDYDKKYFAAIGPDPDRYGKLRNSPCFALYQARPVKEKQAAQRTQ